MASERQIHEWTDRKIRQKQVWLETFGPEGKKPREDYPEKENDILILKAIRFDYASALKIKAEKPPATIKAAEIVEWCRDQINDRYDWLDLHGSKAPRGDRRPDMEVDLKQDDIDNLYQIRKTYEAAIEARKNRG